MPAEPKPAPATPSAAWAVALQVREARAARLEALQAVVDGAVLAVEQVQDMRIDLLEQGPEVLIEDIVFDTLLGLALGEVGQALRTCTDSIAAQLADSAAAFASTAQHPKAAEILGSVIRASDADRFAGIFGGEERGAAPVTPAEIKRYNGAVRAFLADRIGQKLDVAAEKSLGIVQTGLPKGAAKTVNLEPTDTPAVSMLSAAQAYVSAQRHALEVFHATAEAMVLGGGFSEKELQLLGRRMAARTLEASYNEIRDRHKMLFEAALWCRLFDVQRPARLGGTWFLSRRAGHLDLGGAPAPLVRYWCRRFGRTIAQVIQGDYRRLQGSETARSRLFATPFEQLKPIEQESLLKQLMDMVGADFDRVLQATETTIDQCGFTNTTSTIPKT